MSWALRFRLGGGQPSPSQLRASLRAIVHLARTQIFLLQTNEASMQLFLAGVRCSVGRQSFNRLSVLIRFSASASGKGRSIEAISSSSANSNESLIE